MKYTEKLNGISIQTKICTSGNFIDLFSIYHPSILVFRWFKSPVQTLKYNILKKYEESLNKTLLSVLFCKSIAYFLCYLFLFFTLRNNEISFKYFSFRL